MKYIDRIKETTTTTGTGNLTLLGAATNFQTFITKFAVNEHVSYCIVDDTNNTWEVGNGYLTDATTFVRLQVFDNSSGTTTQINLGSGTKTIFCTIPAYKMSRIDIMGHSYAKMRGFDMN